MESLVFQVNFLIYYITMNPDMNQIHYTKRPIQSVTFNFVLLC